MGQLTPMRYKNYTWPHNPTVYSISYLRQMATHKVPFGRYCLQDLGLTRRVMQGEGAFIGPEAYEEFRKLAVVFYQDGPGLLVHPVWSAAEAHFVSLQLEQQPRPDYVQYSFSFWEGFSRYPDGLTEVKPAGGGQADSELFAPEKTQTHTVVKGDSLWAIAGRYGVSLKSILALNPGIKNPNLIYPGEKVRVR